MAIALQVRCVVFSHSFFAALRAAASEASASDLNTRRLGDTAKPSHPVELTIRLGRDCGSSSVAKTSPGTITDKSTAAAKIEPEDMRKLPIFSEANALVNFRQLHVFDLNQPVSALVCFLAVAKKERMSANSMAPSDDRKPPKIF